MTDDDNRDAAAEPDTAAAMVQAIADARFKTPPASAEPASAAPAVPAVEDLKADLTITELVGGEIRARVSWGSPSDSDDRRFVTNFGHTAVKAIATALVNAPADVAAAVLHACVSPDLLDDVEAAIAWTNPSTLVAIAAVKIAALTAENAEMKAARAPVDRIAELEAALADRDATIASLSAPPPPDPDPLNALTVSDVREDLIKTRHRLYSTSRALANSLDVALLGSMSWHRTHFGICPSSSIVLRAIDEMAELYAATLRREIQAGWHGFGVTDAGKFLQGRAAIESQTFTDVARRAAAKHLTAFDLNPTSGTQTDIAYEMADVLIVLSGVLARLTGGYEYDLRMLADNVTRKTAINREVDR